VVESKWVNGGVAVAVAGALTGLAVWMSSGPSPEQAPRGTESGRVESDVSVAPADRPVQEPPTKGGVADATEGAPADMGSFPAGGTTKGRAENEPEGAAPDAGNLPRPSGGEDETEAAAADRAAMPKPPTKG
jgi:hypothetical protein